MSCLEEMRVGISLLESSIMPLKLMITELSKELKRVAPNLKSIELDCCINVTARSYAQGL